jgi:TolB protein
LLACLFVVPAFAQTGKVGIFSNSDDVGASPLEGGAEFDASIGQYRITGTGTEIWAKADRPQLRLAGNVRRFCEISD